MKKSALPFIMKADGVRSIFGPATAEGPFPEHYEPLESPLTKNPMSDQLNNPAIEIFECDLNQVVCTTYSCTEHLCSGALTR